MLTLLGIESPRCLWASQISKNNERDSRSRQYQRARTDWQKSRPNTFSHSDSKGARSTCPIARRKRPSLGLSKALSVLLPSSRMIECQSRPNSDSWESGRLNVKSLRAYLAAVPPIRRGTNKLSHFRRLVPLEPLVPLDLQTIAPDVLANFSAADTHSFPAIVCARNRNGNAHYDIKGCNMFAPTCVVGIQNSHHLDILNARARSCL